ncbi:uncharacterized protein LOC144359190 [Saccoglossus kowalevskii]
MGQQFSSYLRDVFDEMAYQSDPIIWTKLEYELIIVIHDRLRDVLVETFDASEGTLQDVTNQLCDDRLLPRPIGQIFLDIDHIKERFVVNSEPLRDFHREPFIRDYITVLRAVEGMKRSGLTGQAHASHDLEVDCKLKSDRLKWFAYSAITVTALCAIFCLPVVIIALGIVIMLFHRRPYALIMWIGVTWFLVLLVLLDKKSGKCP